MTSKLKRSGLGRGLGALLEDTPEKNEVSGSGAAPVGGIGEILLSSIEVNPFQPRTDFNEEALEELAASIKIQGIIQPITVRKLNDTSYQLISGERRFQASKRAGLEKIPAYIRTANDQQMLEMALIENIQRENLNAIEIALSYQRLLSECNLKQEELGDRVGKNRTTVTNYLRLLRLPPDIQIAIRDGELTMGHARALLSLEKIEDQLMIYKKILLEGLSVRKVEEMVRELSSKKNEPVSTKIATLNSELSQLQSKMSSHFGTRIKIKSADGNKGEINIPFESIVELNRILDIISI